MIALQKPFWPWARAEPPAAAPVNVRITPRPAIVCVRQEDLDRARLRDLANQCNLLCEVRGAFPPATHRDDPALNAAIAALDAWIIENGQELDFLLRKVKKTWTYSNF